jgi:hypothetical protein
MTYVLATMRNVAAVTTDASAAGTAGIAFTTVLKNGTTAANHHVTGEAAHRLLDLSGSFNIADMEGRECVVSFDKSIIEWWAFASMVDTTEFLEVAEAA